MRKTIVAVGAAVAIVLSGCGGPPPAEPTPTATPSASSTPSPTPTPTPTPTIDMSDPANWVIAADAVGPIYIGQPIADALAAASGYVQGESVPDCRVAFLDRDGVASIAIAYWPDDLVTQIIVRVLGESPVSAPDLYAASPKTAEGIGIGSTLADFLASYPDAAVLRDDGPSFSVYSIAGPTGDFIVVSAVDGVIESLSSSVTGTFAYELC
ncbi:MAG: hypothetical protein U1E32_05430 [Rhodoglobus sp.]|nr:hypothetical protein [Rhodoglobus sp.]